MVQGGNWEGDASDFLEGWLSINYCILVITATGSYKYDSECTFIGLLVLQGGWNIRLASQNFQVCHATDVVYQCIYMI